MPSVIPSSERRVSDVEKHVYVRSYGTPFALLGLASCSLLLLGMWRFASAEDVLLVFVPFVTANTLYLLLSFGILLPGSRFSLAEHARKSGRLLRDATPRAADASVDVFLPVCGESRQVILETWDAVRRLRWRGEVNVYVLDDSAGDDLRGDAERYGFRYLRRPTRELRKAGNLRHAFLHSSGEFVLLLDADFSPRPEMLEELMPYLLEDDRVAVAQSPQYFDVDRRMGWVEAGAGYVQELFYRLIQPARDRWGAAVCVGSCAIYRRSALAEVGGTAAIEHSEDIWTGFELTARGWKVRYVPVVLAKGLCPDRLETFFTQQYRWSCGSLSLCLSARFWRSPLTAPQKLCYAAGLAYYLATALNVLLAPLPPLVMVVFFADRVHWSQLAFTASAFLYSTAVLGLWSRYPFGLHYLTCREVSAAANLSALLDALRGRRMGWVVSGARPTSHDVRLLRGLARLFVCSASAAALVLYLSARHVLVDPARWVDFAPPVFFATVHAAVCWRALVPPRAAEFLRRDVASLGERLREFREQSVFAQTPVRTAFYFGVAPLVLSGAAMWSIGDRWTWAGDVADAPPTEVTLASPAPPADTDLSPWTVVDAFPGADLRGSMRIRQHPHDDRRYFVADFTGTIDQVTQTSSGWRKETVVDLSGGELAWLFSFALHPRYADNGKIYLVYRTEPSGARASYRVSEVDVSRAAATADDERILIEQEVAHEEHLGGDLEFDDKGFLFVSVGDNGHMNDDSSNAQRIDRGLFSGILRIDVDRRGGDVSHPPPRQPAGGRTAGYFIPNDNPFVGRANALEEFWAVGFRNPFRVAYDGPARRLWVGEVGQDHFEQVEVASAGTNHLWSFAEGTAPFFDSPLQGQMPQEMAGRPTLPLHEYRHADQDYCVIGGALYRGRLFPELDGTYVFGDNQSGRVWALDPHEPEKKTLLLQLPFTKPGSTLTSIGTDRQGNVFFTNFISRPAVYRLTRSTHLRLPERLSETGFFTDLRSLHVADDFVRYDVAVPLWSDGLEKRRWFRLPPGTAIGNASAGAWTFPAGTVFLKHFDTPDPESPRKVETRVLLVKEGGHVAGASYVWNEEGTDASLQLERKTAPLSWSEPSGGKPVEFNYHVPGFRDCVVCHNRENPVLGANLFQLNHAREGDAGNQLVSLSRLGVFQRPYEPHALAQLPSLARIDDEEAPLELRARSYLHANCAFCHFTNSMRRVDFDLRLDAPAGRASLVDKTPQLHYLLIDGETPKHLISPGDSEASAIYRRMRTEDRELAMPYLGRTRPDERALRLIHDWIKSLPSASPRDL